jgi:hypothetical protein
MEDDRDAVDRGDGTDIMSSGRRSGNGSLALLLAVLDTLSSEAVDTESVIRYFGVEERKRREGEVLTRPLHPGKSGG